MSKIIKLQRGRRGLIGLVAATTIILAGCTGTEDGVTLVDSTVTLPEMASPASLTTTSAASYDDNIYGLITGATLDNWINGLGGWPDNKPAGLAADSKLIILQSGVGEVGSEYITSDPGNGVFTYLAPMVNEVRSNGVVQTKSMVPSGEMMDIFLSKYNIDPSKDMVVCAQGKASTGGAMGVGRCWYTFRYWGMLKGQVAVLNGGNEWNTGAPNLLAMSSTADIPPETGTASVKDLPAINFALQATLEDMINIIPATDTNVLDDGVFIWDARGIPEYSPKSDADFRSGPTQGHPNGALELNFTSLLIPGEGWRFKDKADLEGYMAGTTPGFVDATEQLVGENGYQDGDTIYTYCETTYRAMVTGFATAAILGLPTRFYDGAMTEWHALSAVEDSNGELLMPVNSPWRTDTVDRSFYVLKSVAVDPPTTSGVITDAYAGSAQNIIIEDLAYKGIIVDTGSSTDDGSSGGAPVPNGCGG